MNLRGLALAPLQAKFLAKQVTDKWGALPYSSQLDCENPEVQIRKETEIVLHTYPWSYGFGT